MNYRRGLVLLAMVFFMGVLSPINSIFAQSATVGEEVVIKLSANYTTGFNWKLAQGDSNLTFLRKEFKLSSYSEGSGGIDHWYFIANAPGEAKLVFVYSNGCIRHDSYQTIPVSIHSKK